MLANKLNVLMAERQLNIKDVVQGTGLSRNTISNLINSSDKGGINLRTINKLCMFFNVTPADFFEYFPYEATYQVDTFDTKGADVTDFLLNTKIEHNGAYFQTEDLFYFDTTESPIYLGDEGAKDTHVITLGEYNETHITSEIDDHFYSLSPIMFQRAITQNVVNVLEQFIINHLDSLFGIQNKEDFDKAKLIFVLSWKVVKQQYSSETNKFLDL
ncbi:helix-turn-helix transcriptional regulator [Lentilactobacillus parafarraginis]|uniref:Helix-turn-helix transcriptional regulator n=1 Tax=Lentilactobacillus parafarraginis TaxID=390842 RepID=A0A5R9CYF0_9LACO|nr:helix-turn-helix transcriptional regulator [Lentilactobacillus parafarraginis]TLQ20137.1 helix-turn-helix transcriptional regulator [Lentilactobacillus parafarraginis]